MPLLQTYTVEKLREDEARLRNKIRQEASSVAPSMFRIRNYKRELSAVVIELGNRGEKPRPLEEDATHEP